MAAPSITSPIAIGLGTVLITIIGAIIFKKIKKEKIPTEWEKVGTVKELLIFPLKSGKAIKANSLFLTEKGMKEVDKNDNSVELRDRSFLIYRTKDREVVTARKIPKSVLIEIEAAENGIILRAPNKVDLYINIPKVQNNVRVIQLWGSSFGNEVFTCTDCGDSAAKWLSTFLLGSDDGLRLGYGDGSHVRNVVKLHNKWAQYYKNMDNKLAGIFSDLASLHVVNSATVDDLNEHLPEDSKVTFMNFRPNVFVEGPEAFAEDHWTYVKIGDVVTKLGLECLRCIETTVSQNGVMNNKREPVNTLEKYRKTKGPFRGGVMGVYMKVLKTGKVSKGDPVYVPKIL